jgi:methionine-rich copper-binding protein CopC
MERSEPADGSKVQSVSEIRLYFTGAPLMRGASVRVVTSGRQLMRSTPPAPDAEDPKQVFVHMEPPLGPGTYVVQWRCIADDGHVMRGDFTFEVVPE